MNAFIEISLMFPNKHGRVTTTQAPKSNTEETKNAMAVNFMEWKNLMSSFFFQSPQLVDKQTISRTTKKPAEIIFPLNQSGFIRFG